jgi:hypothetical protein
VLTTAFGREKCIKLTDAGRAMRIGIIESGLQSSKRPGNAGQTQLAALFLPISIIIISISGISK